MTEELREKLPLDAKLLADAVIELNISRRSVGIYPPEHPIIKNAIDGQTSIFRSSLRSGPALPLALQRMH